MIYKLKVTPNAPEDKITNKDGYLEIKVKSKPEKGKANLSVLKLLKKKFPDKKIKLKGLTSRNKFAEIK